MLDFFQPRGSLLGLFHAAEQFTRKKESMGLEGRMMFCGVD
jgi:hypothetical protein